MCIILLASCATPLQTQSDELHELALTCNKRKMVPVIENGIVKMENGSPVMHLPEDSCEKEWTAWNEVEEKILDYERKREERKVGKCPGGQVGVCGRWCMMSPPSQREMQCISTQDVRDAINRY